MRRFTHRARKAIASLVVVTLLSGGVSATTAKPAQATFGCLDGGYVLVYARGVDSDIRDTEEVKKFAEIVDRLPGSVFRELGDLDDNRRLDPGHYDANLWDWFNSVNRGVQELDAFIRERQHCTRETLVFGGYSMGAEVMGQFLNRLTEVGIRNRIGFAALYGDTRYVGGAISQGNCVIPWWVRIRTAPCETHGTLGPRWPYVPRELFPRVGSWCHQDDAACMGTVLGHLGLGTHGDAYKQLIPQSAPYIAAWAKNKRNALNPELPAQPGETPAEPTNPPVEYIPPPRTPIEGSIVESSGGVLYVMAGGRLFALDRSNAAMVAAFADQSRRKTGTDIYVPMAQTAVWAIEANRSDAGSPLPGAHMPRDHTWLYEYGNQAQYVVKFGHAFSVGSPEEVVALEGQNLAVMVPPGSVRDLQTHPPQWVQNDLLQFWGGSAFDPTVWHFVDRGHRVPSPLERDCLMTRWNRVVTPMPASAWNLFPTHVSQQAACDFNHGQWLYGSPSNRQVMVLYGAGHYVQYGEVAPLGGVDQAKAVSDYSVDQLMGSSLSLPNYHLFKAVNSPTVYMVASNVLQQVGSPSVRDCLMATYGTVVESVPQSFIDRLPKGVGAQCPYEGRLLMKSGGQVDYVQGGERHWVPNDAVHNCLKGRRGTGNAIVVEQWVWDSYTTGSRAFCPYGTAFVQESNSSTVWLAFADGTKKHAGSLCVPDPYTTGIGKYRVWIVPAGETAGHVETGDWFGSGQLCEALPG